MHITVITGSPHKNGTTALLAEEFIRGAREAGHQVFRFDGAFEEVGPCLGCDSCGNGKLPCVQRDGMVRLYPHLLATDLVVFVTPLYYFAASAQLMAVLDRFYAVNSKLMGGERAYMLLAACGQKDAAAMDGLVTSLRLSMADYLGWRDAGALLAAGCNTREDVEKTDFPRRAYELGLAADGWKK